MHPAPAILAEATEAARTVRPGLVLPDIQLPDFDGFEVARRLAADPPPARLRWWC